MIRRRYRILGIALAAVAITVVAGAFAVRYNSPCAAAEPVPAGVVRMKAVIQRCYGSPEVLRIEEVAKPTPAENEVLVKVRAASINPADWHGLTGTPYVAARPSTGLGAPSNIRFGTDYAGVVEAVGSNVTTFKLGDEVFGARSGSMAEYVEARADRSIVLKPESITFEQAAAIPIAAITALQGLRDKGQIRPGQKVLINGASGGVGTFAVQIAKAFGAEVTGVCSTRNVELVRSLGADQIIDYTKENFTEGTERYDLILDNVGNHSVLATRRALKPEGKLVLASGPKSDPWLGPELLLMSPFVSLRESRSSSDIRFARTPSRMRSAASSGLLTSRTVPSVRSREYLTPDEVERLIAAAKSIGVGARSDRTSDLYETAVSTGGSGLGGRVTRQARQRDSTREVEIRPARSGAIELR